MDQIRLSFQIQPINILHISGTDLSPVLPVLGWASLWSWGSKPLAVPSMEELHTFKTQHKGKTVRYYNTCAFLIIPADPSLIKIGSKMISNCEFKLASLVTRRQKSTFKCSTATHFEEIVSKWNKKHPKGELGMICSVDKHNVIPLKKD